MFWFIQIGLSGYNEKLPILLEKVMSKMTNFQVDEKRLEILKELVSTIKIIRRDYKNEK